jgi:DNA repair and recombination protein RAD54B
MFYLFIYIKVLDGLLTELHQSSPNEKAVVVSNFTSALESIQILAMKRGWGLLRIDGSVPTNKRQSLVDSFNRASDTRFLFLLSSKAGGVYMYVYICMYMYIYIYIYIYIYK